MANKTSYYYLINGNEAESRTMYIPTDNSYLNSHKDISGLDISTIDLGVDYHEKIQYANPLHKLHRNYYIGKYPYSHGIKIFKPILIFKETNKSIKLVNGFREIAEERLFNCESGNSKTPDNKTKSINLVEDILNDLSPTKKRMMFSQKSILGRDIKRNFFDNKYLFEIEISNYTQLRNLLINYLYLLDGRDIPDEYRLYSMSRSLDNILDLEHLESVEIEGKVKAYHDAIDKAKDEEEKKKVIDDLNYKNDNSGQLNIFDLFGVEKNPQGNQGTSDVKTNVKIKR